MCEDNEWDEKKKKKKISIKRKNIRVAPKIENIRTLLDVWADHGQPSRDVSNGTGDATQSFPYNLRFSTQVVW